MAKNDKSNQSDEAADKADREKAAADKAAAYDLEQKAAADKAKAEADAEAAAKLQEAQNEDVDESLVKMRKGDDVLAVHVSTVADHKAAGWQVI